MTGYNGIMALFLLFGSAILVGCCSYVFQIDRAPFRSKSIFICQIKWQQKKKRNAWTESNRKFTVFFLCSIVVWWLSCFRHVSILFDGIYKYVHSRHIEFCVLSMLCNANRNTYSNVPLNSISALRLYNMLLHAYFIFFPHFKRCC